MDNSESFVFYKSFWEALKELPDEMRLHVLDAVTDYAFTKKVPETLTSFESAVFKLIRPQIDASNKRREQSIENGIKGKEYGKLGAEYGKRGGRPKKNASKAPLPEENIETPLKGGYENPGEGDIENPLGGDKKTPLNVNVNVNSISSLSTNKANLKESKQDGIDGLDDKENIEEMDIGKDEIESKCIEYDDLTFSEDFKRRMDKMQEFIEKFNIVTDYCGYMLEEADWDKIEAEFAASSYLRSNPRYRSLKWIAYNHKTIEGGCFRPKNGPTVIEEQEKIEGNPFEDWK